MPTFYKILSAVHRKFLLFYFLPAFIVLIPVIILCGCNTGKNAYCNVYEKDYMKRTRWSIMIWHDKKAIKHQTKEGVYTISSGASGICNKDTNSIITSAIRRAKYVRKFMNHKENYRYIDVVYDGNKIRNDSVPDRNRPTYEEVISCFYQIRMPLDDITNAKIMHGYTNYSPEFHRRVIF